MNERWWIDPRHHDDLASVAPPRVAAWIDAARHAEVLSSDRQSIVARLDGAPPLLVKWRHTLPGRRRHTLGRASRERREARNTLRARALGVPGPAPWAVGEVRERGTVVAAVLVRPFDERAQPAVEVLAADETAPAAFAAQLCQWHALGWRHGGCYPKNVLLLEDRETFAPIGYPSAHFTAADRHDAARAKDLAQACLGLEALGACDADTFLAAYGDVSARVRAATAARSRTIRARKAERERSRPTREPQGPPRPHAFTGTPRRLRTHELLALVE